MTELRIRQVRSCIGQKNNQRETLRSLGLGAVDDETVRAESTQVRGMIDSVGHLIDVRPINSGEGN